MENLDKEKIIFAILKELDKERLAAIKNYESYQRSSNESPSPMQSRSDTSRFQFGILGQNELARAEKISRVITIIKDALVKKFESAEIGSLLVLQDQSNREILCFCLVPEGAGGQLFTIDGFKIQSIAINSPIGKAIVSKKVDDWAEILSPSTRRFKILSIK